MSKKDKAVKRTSIGGQAVLEGVMMKGATAIATAVRTESGDITVESVRTKSAKDKSAFAKLPFVRGVVNLCTQLYEGMGILMRSAEVYGDFAEPSEFEKQVAKKFKINPMNILMGFSLILGIVLAVGLFVVLPNVVASALFKIDALANSSLSSLWYSLIESAVMLVIFTLYIVLVSIMKDIRRVFMYHGAEHKVINCYEHGLDLTVENAKKMSRQHSRCGTTFMFLVIMVSIIVFAFVNWGLSDLPEIGEWFTSQSKGVQGLVRVPIKLLFIPVVAGISYEILKLLAKSDALPVRILRSPGMALQLLTTREPDDSMLEVSLTAFKTVQAMDADPSYPTRKFDIKMPVPIARKRIAETAPTADESDIDWILVEVTGKKRGEVQNLSHISAAEYENAMKIAEKMKDGAPLQYALGYTEFYGIKIVVNSSVLIPRPETEELVEKAIAVVKEKSENGKVGVLDLCTGSGAIAVAIAKNTNANVSACDVSVGAVDVALANSVNTGVRVDFSNGDMWGAVAHKRFDVIVSNPPYIPTDDVSKLDVKVKDFEPTLALDGDKDGLKFYRIIADGLDEHLEENGVLLLEFGIGQTDNIKEIFAGYDVEVFKDMEGLDRIAVVRRKSAHQTL